MMYSAIMDVPHYFTQDQVGRLLDAAAGPDDPRVPVVPTTPYRARAQALNTHRTACPLHETPPPRRNAAKATTNRRRAQDTPA